MDQSIFMDKASIPTDENLRQALGIQYELWMEIRARVFQKYPGGAAFVFGGKAFEAIKESNISPEIVSDLEAAKVYAEGRGIRIPVPDRSALKDISRLIDIKLAH